MSTSNIEWTDDTPNPIVGCTKQSAGCENCYAIRMAWRLMHSDKPAVREKYAGTVKKTAAGKLNWTGKINIDHTAMARVIKQKNPKMYFVNSMGDLFHPSVKFTDIDIVFAAMAQCPQHIFQILTKHPDRMLNWLNHVDEKGLITRFRIRIAGTTHWKQSWCSLPNDLFDTPRFLLNNVWMGTSIENQKEANTRSPFLKAVAEMGWKTWISNEPSLGEIDWTGCEFVRWIVTGGESGPGSRPMHPEWAKQTRYFCDANRIPFFFKQWGVWAPVDEVDPTHDIIHEKNVEYICISTSGQTSKVANDLSQLNGEKIAVMYKFGKHVAGRLFDGKEYGELLTDKCDGCPVIGKTNSAMGLNLCGKCEKALDRSITAVDRHRNRRGDFDNAGAGGA